MNPRVISDQENQFLLEITPGKPDSKVPLENHLKDTRPRVMQRPDKGITSWYHALSLVRVRYGSSSLSFFPKERNFEKLCSEYRKRLNELHKIKTKAIDLYYEFARCIIHEGVTQHSDNTTLFSKMLLKYTNTHATLIENINANSPIDLDLLRKVGETFTLFFNVFKTPVISVSAENSFHSFKRYMDRTDEIARCMATRNFIEQKLQLDPVQLFLKYYNAAIDQMIAPQVASDEQKFRIARDLLSVNSQQTYVFLKAIFLKLCFESYNLDRSRWNPEQSIAELITELRSHGPMVAWGKLGVSCYKSNAVALSQTIGSRTIWAWERGSFITEAEGADAIVVIGAEKINGQENVFFVDTHDPSDPKNIEAQKIYKMSFARFKASLRDFWNGWEDMPEQDRGYLVYRNSLK